MDRDQTHGYPPALVIGGMHRSGTSLTASILAAAGVHLGESLMEPATSNPKGHFEDLEFYRLHKRILAANGLCMDGFTCQETIDPPASSRAEAFDLVHRRRAANRPWGWKDPRTILFLNFWASLVPEARWLFVVRSPEEVIDSLLRRGDTAFSVNPRHAVDVWVAYTRRILEFVQQHPERAAVVDIARVVAEPESILKIASDLLGMELATPEPTYEPGLLQIGQSSHRSSFVRALRPEAHDLYDKLLGLAGRDTTTLPARGPTRMIDVAEAGMAEWAAACRSRAERASLADAGRRQSQSDHEWTQRIEAARAERDEAVADLQLALDEALALTEAAHATRDEVVQKLESQHHALRFELKVQRTEYLADLETQKANFFSELETQRASFHAEFEAQRDGELAKLQAQIENLRSEHEAQKQRIRLDCEAQMDALRSELAEDKSQAVAMLEVERDGLVAQLEAERVIHESLRMDMTGRIETAVAGTGRDILG